MLRNLVTILSLFFLTTLVKAKDYGDRVVGQKRFYPGSFQKQVYGSKEGSCSKKPYQGFKGNFASLQKVAIMGDDNRFSLTNEEKNIPEFKQVGQISVTGGSLGSGIITGENCDIFVTAGHAVRNSEDGSKIGTKYEYFDNGRSKNGIEMKVVSTGWNTNKKVKDFKNDWAILKLSKPAFEKCKQIKVTPYSSKKPSDANCSGDLTTVGTHEDDWEDEKIVRKCKSFPPQTGTEALADIDEVFLHDCDMKTFASGSPIFCVEKGGDLSLVGIMKGDRTVKGYKDPKEFGKPSSKANPFNHINYAVSIWGGIQRALDTELAKSKERKKSKKVLRPKASRGAGVNQSFTQLHVEAGNFKTKTNVRYLELHHKIPVSSGGGNQQNNLVVLCSGHHKAFHEHYKKGS